MEKNNLLIIAAGMSFLASLLHLACIFGGAEWYRFFGAGERMAHLAEAGDLYPTAVTSIIAGILAVWGLYALSGAGVIFKLPLLKTGLVLITAIYLIRGVVGFVLPFVTSDPVVHQNSITFWLVSSAVCTLVGTFYLLGTLKLWR